MLARYNGQRRGGLSRARHACSSERPQECGPPQRRFESVLARYNGRRRGGLGEGVLVAGYRGERLAKRASYSDREAQMGFRI